MIFDPFGFMVSNHERRQARLSSFTPEQRRYGRAMLKVWSYENSGFWVGFWALVTGRFKKANRELVEFQVGKQKMEMMEVEKVIGEWFVEIEAYRYPPRRSVGPLQFPDHEYKRFAKSLMDELVEALNKET